MSAWHIKDTSLFSKTSGAHGKDTYSVYTNICDAQKKKNTKCSYHTKANHLFNSFSKSLLFVCFLSLCILNVIFF